VVDELDIYKRQGFAQTVGLGRSPALVIVDFVVSFTDPAHFGGGNILAAIDNTTHLLAFAREVGWPVAHTRVVYADDGSDAGVFARKAPGLLKLTEHSPLSQIISALSPKPGELVVRKQQASAFFGTGFAAWLTGRGADTLVVAAAARHQVACAPPWSTASLTTFVPSCRRIVSAIVRLRRTRPICSTWARNTRTS
jgi:maleamate amidohydrolase